MLSERRGRNISSPTSQELIDGTTASFTTTTKGRGGYTKDITCTRDGPPAPEWFRGIGGRMFRRAGEFLIEAHHSKRGQTDQVGIGGLGVSWPNSRTAGTRAHVPQRFGNVVH